MHPKVCNLFCVRDLRASGRRGRNGGCGDRAEYGAHGIEDSLVWLDFSRSVNKKEIGRLGKQFFLPAVALTDAALEEVALDGTLEKALRYGNDNPGGKVCGGRDGAGS